MSLPSKNIPSTVFATPPSKLEPMPIKKSQLCGPSLQDNTKNLPTHTEANPAVPSPRQTDNNVVWQDDLQIEPKLNVDDLIGRLTSFRDSRPGLPTIIHEYELRQLNDKVSDIFKSQSMLLEVDAPIIVVGDIHGQFIDLLRIFERSGYPDKFNYLFLGDYVDRGRQSIETITLLFAYKVKFPTNFFMLRGNHECAQINRVYGFFDEVKRRFSAKLWKIFCDTFNNMPACAIISSRILCMHGGLSPDLSKISEINNIARPQDIPENGLYCDLLWSDPNPSVDGWAESNRGVSFTFGRKVVREFCESNDIDLIVRAHQVVEDGYELFADKRLLTLFSAPNYCGEFDNGGAVLRVGNDLVTRIEIVRPNLPAVTDDEIDQEHDMESD